MTCEVFNDIIKNRKPMDCTAAERAAVLKHGNECPQCSAVFDGSGTTLLGTIAAVLQMAIDSQDPEYAAIISSIKPHGEKS